MTMFKKLATAGTVALIGFGAGAAGASAYAISGGAYTATATNDHTFTVGGAYTSSCPAALTMFSGTATGSASTGFTPFYGGTGDCESFGFATTNTQSGSWTFTVTSGPDGAGWYSGEVTIPFGTTTTLSIPIVGCTVTTTGPQTFQHGVNGNVFRVRNTTPTGLQVEATVNNIAYSGSGCPFSSGTDGAYSTNGVVDVPGITIS